MGKKHSKPRQLTDGFTPVTLADWQAAAIRSMKGRKPDDPIFLTADGIEIKTVYEPATNPVHIGGMGSGAPLVMPLVAETDPGRANLAVLAELEGGADGIVLQFSAPGQTGLPLTVKAMNAALDGVFLDAANLALAFGAGDVSAAISCFETLTCRPGEPPTGLRFDADPIGSALRLDIPVSQSNLAALAGCATALTGMPKSRLFSASGVPAHEAGATEAQELAAMLASGVAYLRALEMTGYSPEAAAPLIGLELTADTDLFLSLAKLRAARLLWPRILGLCGTTGSGNLHVRSSARMMARKDVHTNLLRTTVAALAAGLGSADSLTILPFTRASDPPDILARRMARNTMKILDEESYIGVVRDPASGAGLVEHLTEDLAAIAWEIFRKIETAGGGASPAGAEILGDLIKDAGQIRKQDIASGSRTIVGVNAYHNAGDKPARAERA